MCMAWLDWTAILYRSIGHEFEFHLYRKLCRTELNRLQFSILLHKLKLPDQGIYNAFVLCKWFFHLFLSSKNPDKMLNREVFFETKLYSTGFFSEGERAQSANGYFIQLICIWKTQCVNTHGIDSNFTQVNFLLHCELGVGTVGTCDT